MWQPSYLPGTNYNTVLGGVKLNEGASAQQLPQLCYICPRVARYMCMRTRMHRPFYIKKSTHVYAKRFVSKKIAQTHTCGGANVRFLGKECSMLAFLDTRM